MKQEISGAAKAITKVHPKGITYLAIRLQHAPIRGLDGIDIPTGKPSHADNQRNRYQLFTLTLCPCRNLLWQRASYVATSTSPSLGDADLTTKKWRATRPTRLLSHLTNPLAPKLTLSILGSRIAFQSPTQTSHFESFMDGVDRRKKETLSAALLGA